MEGLNWLEWDKEAFLRAKKEKKPVLLDISAVWCHWCHTMDKLTYGNKEIADFIRKHFVTVKVDTDKRPDINERYNVGGWPSTLILAHDGDVVSAATYVPPQHMIKFLTDALQRFEKYKPKKKKEYAVQKSVELDENYFYDLVKSFYDPINGGFGLEPKFPHPDILDFLLWKVMRDKDNDARKMLEHSLKAMSNGEIFDRIGGGFFRYATQQNWTYPHFEKMLDDNAKLFSVYLHAYQLFKKDEYLSVANRILFFIFTMLYDREKGVFYCSQDADEEYCKLEFEKRFLAPPPAIDTVIYTDSNASLALSLFVAAELDDEYESVALSILEFLYKNNIRGGVTHYYTSEKPLYLLKDHVYLLAALVQAFVKTNRLEWRAKALTVAKHLERFYDKKNGGFFDILADKSAVGRMKERKKPVNENAFAALVLKELARISKNDEYLKMAHKSLHVVSANAMALGPYASIYAIAVGELK